MLTRREEIAARLAAIRPPWKRDLDSRGVPLIVDAAGRSVLDASLDVAGDDAIVFASEAPADIAYLLAELARVEGERDEARADRDAFDAARCAAVAEAAKEALADNPDFDATDGAHPAWWRGHDHGARGMAAALYAARAARIAAVAEADALRAIVEGRETAPTP